jgi:hypothetical protein
MFLNAPLKSGELFTIPLINRDTGERLLFQFQSSQQIGGMQTPIEKQEAKEGKEPKKNFGP